MKPLFITLLFFFAFSLAGCDDVPTICTVNLSQENLLFNLKSNQTPREVNQTIPQNYSNISDNCANNKPRVHVKRIPNFTFHDYTDVLNLEFYNNRLMTTTFEFTLTGPSYKLKHDNDKLKAVDTDIIDSGLKCTMVNENQYNCSFYAVDKRLLEYLRLSEYSIFRLSK